MKDLVYVNGNIVAKSGRHLAKEWITLAPNEYKCNAAKVIEGDLYLDEKNQLLSYLRYAASGGVSSLIIGGIETIPSPKNIRELYDDDVKKIEELLQFQVPEHLESDRNRHLYVGIISDLELFLTELLSCLVLGNEHYYNRFIENTDCVDTTKMNKEELYNAPLKIHRYIHKNYNYHRLYDVGIIYTAVFNTDFPKYDRLQKMIDTRHDLAHRGGYTLKEHQIVHLNVTQDMVYNLIKECDIFINDLINMLKEPIAKWEVK